LSLPRSRVAAACRLRRSCHRPRGPVALPRSGCPVRRSRHPAASRQSQPIAPPPPPRCILRSRSAATPRPTSAKRRAIFRHKTHPTTNQDPHTPRLLDPAYSLRPKQKGVRFAHVRFELPPLGLMVPPRGPARCFRCGARLARGGAPAEEGRGVPRTPFQRARSLPPPHSAANVIAKVNARYSRKRVLPGWQASRAPPPAPRPSVARSAQA